MQKKKYQENLKSMVWSSKSDKEASDDGLYFGNTQDHQKYSINRHIKSLSRSSVIIEPSTSKSKSQNKMPKRSKSILSNSQPRNFSSPSIHSSQEKILETKINSDAVAD